MVETVKGVQWAVQICQPLQPPHKMLICRRRATRRLLTATSRSRGMRRRRRRSVARFLQWCALRSANLNRTPLDEDIARSWGAPGGIRERSTKTRLAEASVVPCGMLSSQYSDVWVEAMRMEFDVLVAAGTFAEVGEIPEGCSIVDAKWLCKWKRDLQGTFDRAKSRLWWLWGTAR